MGTANCENCNNLFTFDVVPRRGYICFRCHLKGIRLGFSHGKEAFHGPTFSERRAEIEAGAKNLGIEAERQPEKVWV